MAVAVASALEPGDHVLVQNAPAAGATVVDRGKLPSDDRLANGAPVELEDDDQFAYFVDVPVKHTGFDCGRLQPRASNHNAGDSTTVAAGCRGLATARD